MPITHPYFPPDASIPLFVPNQSPLWLVLATFGTIVGIVLAATVAVARTFNPNISLGSQLAACWFGLSGFLHCVFEAYWLLNSRHVARDQSLFGQVWKEYALADSRYLTNDAFVLGAEAVTTVFLGPLCLLAVVCIVKDSSVRLPIQTVVCAGHLMTVSLYYASSLLESRLHGVSHSRPELRYYWGYFVASNLPWILVPAVLLVRAVRQIGRTVEAARRMEPAAERARVVLEASGRSAEAKKTR